jgi:hypothetical protein
MTVTEFFLYLLDRDTSRELALQLVDTYQVRARRHRVVAASTVVRT